MEKSVGNIHGDIIKIDEAGYHLKNYGNQGGCLSA